MGDDPDGRATQHQDELGAWLALSLAPGIGAADLRRMAERFGSALAVRGAAARELRECASPEAAAAVGAVGESEAVRAALDWAALPSHRILTLSDTDYPAALREIHDYPPVLYVVGDARMLRLPSLAIVGSRSGSAQGQATARAFARALSDAGLTIVSGLALGIDAAAHRGGLDGRAGSVAVLATGADLVYPAAHRPLAHELAERAALVTEFPLGRGARADQFPRRNRIISGLSRGCLVVEAALDSGSLITARLALEQGREVFAIPGSIHSPLSKGCHQLIKQGAKLVESVDDVLDELGWVAPVATGSSTAARDADEPGLCWPGHDPVDADALAFASGLTHEQVSAILLRLEIKGEVACLPGGRYQRIFHNH